MRITVDGKLGFGVSARCDHRDHPSDQRSRRHGPCDRICRLRHSRFVMEGRLTLCNMTIEAGSRIGMVAPMITLDYVEGRPYAPKGPAWEKAVSFWRSLPSDDDAAFDTEHMVDGNAIAPMVTWGNSPQWAAPVTDTIPDPASESDSEKRSEMESTLDYMDLKPGTPISEIKVDKVFIGSCTNARIEDLRSAAAVAKGRRAVVSTLISPGSGLVKRQAEAEGLDKVSLTLVWNGGFPAVPCASV